MLFINPNWHWQFCPQQGVLQLRLNASMVLCSGLKSQQLRHSPVAVGEQAPLTLEYAGCLMEVLEQLEALVPAELAMQCALRIMVQTQFAAATVQKSHYFELGASSRMIQPYSLARLIGQDQARVLVFTNDNQLADCLLLDRMQTLTQKELSPLCHVRVLANRLSPLTSGSAYLLSA